MIFKDYYKILGFDTNKVSLEKIKIAYREQAKKYHPDINVRTKESEEIFKDINEAYRTLSNEKARKKYDFSWYRYVGLKKKKKQHPKQKRTVREFLADIFFGGISKKKENIARLPQYGENVVTRIDVTIEEAFYGANKRIKLRTVNGKESTFTVKVPAGIQNNDKIRIAGQGKLGSNGGRNGDLLIFINIKNSKKIKLDGVDLIYEMPLTVWEAALGTKKTVRIMEEDIQIVVPKAVSSGEELVIKGKGYKDGKGSRGNLRIITKIVLPSKINNEQIKIFEALKKLEKTSINQLT